LQHLLELDALLDIFLEHLGNEFFAPFVELLPLVRDKAQLRLDDESGSLVL